MDLTFFFITDNISSSYGDLAQLVEHTAHIRDVNGSIPLVAIRLPEKGSFFYFKISEFPDFFMEINEI